MTFPEWVQAVLAIAADRGIIVTIDYPSPTWVTFNWRCANSTQFGSAGAGAEFINLTTPEAYTWLWNCGKDGSVPVPDVLGEPWDRHGRFVPRVPAMAVSDALRALFSVALIGGMPAASSLAVYEDVSIDGMETAGPGGTTDGTAGPGKSKDKTKDDTPGNSAHDKPKGKPS